MHDLRRCIPDAQLLAEFRVKGFQEGLVKILYRLTFLEAGEERLWLDTVERCACPVEHLDQPQWHMQFPGGEAPVKGRGNVPRGPFFIP